MIRKDVPPNTSSDAAGSRRIGVRIATLELRDVIAELAMTKAGRCEGEETEGVHERVDATVAESESGGAP